MYRGPQMPDVTVIGGGIIGLTVAFHLREFFPAACITVVEKSPHIPNPYGTSCRSAACIRTQFGCRHNVDMAMYSVRFYERFRHHTGENMNMLWQKGYLFLHHDSKKWGQAKQRVVKQQSWGLTDVRALEPDEVISQFPFVSPIGLVGATYCPIDGYLDPGIIMSALKKKLESQNVRLWTDTSVTGFTTDNDRVVSVNTNRGHLQSDFVVNCAGAWSARIGQMLGTLLDVSPEKRYLWSAEFAQRTDDLSEADFKEVPMIVCLNGNGMTPYLRPDPGSAPHSFTMGCEHPVAPEPYFSDERQDHVETAYKPEMGEGFVGIWNQLADFVPFASKLGFRSRVNGGFYETTPSHNPYITFDPTFCNLIHACGFSGHGVMHAPAAGCMVADLVKDGEFRGFDTAHASLSYAAHSNRSGETEEMKI